MSQHITCVLFHITINELIKIYLSFGHVMRERLMCTVPEYFSVRLCAKI